ncbi:MAG: hypothetical protein IJO03_08850 [Clostridia bacterium]|nr:hypothetical protein [Clostridia bacterium]
MKTRIKAVLPVLVILVVSLAAEFLLSNFVYFAYVAGTDAQRNYTPEDFAENEISEFDSSFALSGLDLPIDSVSFTVKTSDPSQKDGYAVAGFYMADENSTKTAALAKREKIAVGPQERTVTVYLSSYGNASYLDVTFEDFKTELTVSDLIINPVYKFDFNFLRFSLIFALIAFAYALKRGGFVRKALGSMDFGGAASISAAVCVAASCVMMILCFTEGRELYIPYPLEGGVEGYQPYIQQFDAFMKGQLHLDIQPSDGLLALENPYNPGERSGVAFLFDRAFFNGKYFSYFGIAPILTFYLPFYLVSGCVPGDSIVTGFFSVITAVFLPLAVVEWAKLRSKNRPWLAAVCGIGAYFAAMVPFVQRGRAAFYYIASIAGMAFVSAFLFFIIKAFGCEKKTVKIIYAVLAGTSFSLAFLSRINIIIPLALVTAAGIAIYAIKCFKDKKIPDFATEMAALGLPVAAAVAFSLWYNHARFGSPLQFGTDYQLTVADASKYELFSGGIIPSLYHYFIQPFVTTEYFPYIGINLLRFGGYGRSMYVDSSFGIFALPFSLSLFLSPVLFKSDKISKHGKILLAVSLAALPLTAFADFCLGGVIFRYTSDIMLFAAFLSAVILLGFCALMREKYGEGFAHTARKCITALVAVTAVISAAASLSLNGNLAAYSPDVYMAIKDFFVFWS